MNLDFNQLENISNESEFDFNKLEKDCYIDLSLELIHPETLISIGSLQ